MATDAARYCVSGRRCRFAIRRGAHVALVSLHRGRPECRALLEALDTPALQPTWQSEEVYPWGSAQRAAPLPYEEHSVCLGGGAFGWLGALLERASGLGPAHHGVRVHAAQGAAGFCAAA